MQADRTWRMLGLVGVLMLVADPSWAGPTEDAVAEALKQDYSPALRNFVILTMLSMIPVLMIGMTAFTRIIIVLSLLRHALGIPQTPPNSVVITLAICMTYFTMSPVLDRMNHDAVAPYMSEQITAQQAIELAAGHCVNSWCRRRANQTCVRSSRWPRRRSPRAWATSALATWSQRSCSAS